MKAILVPFHEEAGARAALRLAMLLAKRFGSYLEGLLVRGEPIIAFAPGMIVPPTYLTEAVEEWRRFADRARAEFSKTAEGNGLPILPPEISAKGPAVGWREVQGYEPEVVGQRGRLFDVIVIGRSQPPSEAGWHDIRDAALFETGRPVLLAPADTPSTVGSRIVIAWNGSTESARTLAFGLPFLMTANQVEVLTVEGQLFPGPSGDDVVAYLECHGIASQHRYLKTEGRPPGEAILNEAGDIGADLILKGAFTRSRFRQIVFGGATQHILDYANVPTLLAH